MLFLHSVRAEVLPVQTYTTADGLRRNNVIQVTQDSNGFLWFRMDGELARFDGYSFRKYTVDDGLPSPFIYWMHQMKDGTIWISTGAGLVKFNPSGIRQKFNKDNPSNPESMFQLFPFPADSKATDSGILIENEDNTFWNATGHGLYKVEVLNGQAVIGKTSFTEKLTAIRRAKDGTIWFGVINKGLYRMENDGTITEFTASNGIPTIDGKRIVDIAGLLIDRNERLWIGGRETGGLCLLVENPRSGENIVERCYTAKDGLASNGINQLFESSDGSIWISGNEKVTRFSGFDEKKKPIINVLDAKNGLTDYQVNDVFEDRDGNIWISTTEGVKKISKEGFTQFNAGDGLAPEKDFRSIINTVSDDIAVINNFGKPAINFYVNGSFAKVSPVFPIGLRYWSYGQKGSVLHTKDGKWWITGGFHPEELQKFDANDPSKPLLIRFPKVDNPGKLSEVKPEKIYYSKDFPNVKETFQLYEDSRGDVWIVAFGKTCFLIRWDKKTDTFQDYSESLDLGIGWFRAFAEDDAGNLWFGGAVRKRSAPNEVQRLIRFKNGVFETIEIKEITGGMIIDLFFDSRKTLWIGTSYNGLLRIEDTISLNPQAAAYTINSGISENAVATITEDRFGRIYIGSGHGVDRINLQTGEIKFFTVKDGLPNGGIFISNTDKNGSVWFGSQTGIARIIPQADKPRQHPNILITGLRIAGEPQKVSELGETFIELELTAEKNNLAVDFVGLGASLGENLEYQYRLGDENSAWITTAERSLNFANLSAGEYQFSVRAVTSDKLISRQPATFTFTILRPFYLRWWFLTLSAPVVGLGVYRLYLFRVRRLLEIERTRTRIATDLHDDIGADLSKISLLSEVVKMQMNNGSEDNIRLLTKIAETSRKSVDSMRDIVWAINPARDSFSDLVSKMRQFAEETLVEKNIKLNFKASPENQKLKLSMDTRRELYLIFKEAVNNASKYAECSEVEIDFNIVGKEITLTIEDNGKGFDLLQDFEGNGLKNMKRRAENLSGTFEISTAPRTKITVRFSHP